MRTVVALDAPGSTVLLPFARGAFRGVLVPSGYAVEFSLYNRYRTST